MQFQVRIGVKKGQVLHRAVLEDRDGVVFDLSAASDTIPAWTEACRDWARERKSPAGNPAVRDPTILRLIACPPQHPSEEPTFWRIAVAWLTFIEAQPNEEKHKWASSDDEIPVNKELKSWLEDAFVISPGFSQSNTHHFRIRVAKEPLLDDEYEYDDESIRDRYARADWWSFAFHRLARQKRERVLRLLCEHHDILAHLVDRQCRQLQEREARVLRQSFAELCKAMLVWRQDNPSGASLSSVVPELCLCILQNPHDSIEAQRPYLEQLLNFPEPSERKKARLEALTRQSAGDARIAAMVGPISNHYLSQYDLEEAASFWQPLARRQPLLRFILALYRYPRPFAFGGLVLFAVLTGLTVLCRSAEVQPSVARNASFALAVLLTCLLAGATTGTIVLAVQFLQRRGIDYLELFLPRLFGAVVVGLSVLLLQDYAWKLGLNLTFANALLVALLVYTLSFLYVYIDVYRAMRLLPGRKNLLQEALQASSRIFIISVLEAFTITLLAVSILAHAVLTEDLLGQGVAVWLPFQMRLYLFPQLIGLWTGAALFIGAFVQLIWQDRKITSPL